jgi:hypothetical protein
VIQVKVVDCIPMSTVLHKARARHVNYFILDVEVSNMRGLVLMYCEERWSG